MIVLKKAIPFTYGIAQSSWQSHSLSRIMAIKRHVITWYSLLGLVGRILSHSGAPTPER